MAAWVTPNDETVSAIAEITVTSLFVNDLFIKLPPCILFDYLKRFFEIAFRKITGFAVFLNLCFPPFLAPSYLKLPDFKDSFLSNL
ncbi:hypothetical protein LAD12857_00410 [Lacrimispora amygdalina]|uniref:Uncharacterized protein n=1 Tax=Lacrimispora amygdalina TaxID=253257 RepID=A0ABQ5LZB9_9FIRM